MLQQEDLIHRLQIEDNDIPFITDCSDIIYVTSGNQGGSINSSRRELSLRSTSSHSRSPSIRGDEIFYEKRRSSSFDDLRRGSLLSNASYHYYRNKRSSSSKRSRRSQYSDNNEQRRKSNVSVLSSSVKASVKSHRSGSSRRGSKYSYIFDNEPRLSIQIPSVSRRCSELPNGNVKELRFSETKRQRLVCIIAAVFMFILVCSVLAVLITLTHQTDYVVRNETKSQYTFAPDFHP